MDRRKNPFQELYVTETINADRFVSLFSPFLVSQSSALFQPGHVILKGLPGTGKSMLLSLLKPSVRRAYFNNQIEFPVPKEFRRFIGAGINLKRSGVSDFGQRPVNGDFGQSPYYFADYLNYWIVLDIMLSIEEILTCDDVLSDEIGLSTDPKLLDQFASELSRADCWYGYLDNIESFIELKSALSKRIRTYKGYLGFNTDDLPKEIYSTKTAIGEPISQCANTLRNTGLLQDQTEIFIKIDQYEELIGIEEDKGVGIPFQEQIHKLLGSRDHSVSFRLGTRYHSWKSGAKMYATSARLEKKRNFIELSIDSMLRRPENARTYSFPAFAEEIFERRLEGAGLDISQLQTKTLEYVLGKSDKSSVKIKRLLKRDKTKSVLLEKSWPQDWKNFLTSLSKKDPLEARFAEAWCRQKDKAKREVMLDPPLSKPYPWSKPWWRKERVEQAIIQIASRNNQHPEWYGKDDIIGLSGGNILSFLWICRGIWDVWMRDNRQLKNHEDDEQKYKVESIDKDIQVIGILEASESWFEEISSEKGGRQRKLFIHFLGSLLYEKLVSDLPMSYPGHNGFSINLEELDKFENLTNFLNEASDFGDLYDTIHTSKSKDKKKRRKFYLAPILSPYFRITSSHTKEPLYVNSRVLLKWLKDSQGEASNIKPQSSNQLSLDY